MLRRTPETLVDWLVVGIAPFLIMLLVGSLVFYLVEVFYQGDYQLRLIWVLGLFVMAIVCIARISMEEGAAYASLYAIPLAGAVGVALLTFVQVRGPLAPVGPLLNLSLMGLVWWAAHKLTWDCTLIEGGKDFTGQGLMQTTGLDRFFRIRTPNSAETPAETSAPSQPDLIGTSDAGAKNQARPVWEWWKYRDDRPHAPGVWVIYFSLAAIPLFGLGQWFMPSGDLILRRRAFWLLVVYVAAGLALLMSTSFLSLRRYLRQRKLEMPLEMAGVWLGTGGAMVVVLLILASLLPRPNPEYSITHLAPDIRSPDLSPSRWGFGREGAKPKGDAPQTATKGTPSEQSKAGNGSKSNGKSSSGRQSGNQGSNSKQGQQSSGEQHNSSSNSGNSGSQGQSNQGQSSQNQSSPSNQSNSSEQQNGNSGSQNQPNSQQNSGNQSGNQSSSQNKGEQTSGEQNNNAANQNNQPNNSANQSPESQSQSNQSQSRPDTNNNSANQSASDPSSTAPLPDEPPPPPTPRDMSAAIGQFFAYLMHLLKWLFYLAVATVIAWYAWKNREWLLQAWQQLLKELRELWARLFGGKPAPVASAIEAPAPSPPQKRFADFADPFSSGLAARWPLAELVRYTFAAFEARGRDRDCPRGNDQTPLEYAAVVGQLEPALAGEFRSLADLYCQLAFAGGQVPPQAASQLQQLWRSWR